MCKTKSLVNFFQKLRDLQSAKSFILKKIRKGGNVLLRGSLNAVRLHGVFCASLYASRFALRLLRRAYVL